MPLNIYPEYPIDELEQMLIDGVKIPYGEFLTYKDLVDSLSSSTIDWYVWYSMRLPFHDNSITKRAKADVEIDFIVVSKLGIIVLEVKGGNISVDQGRFCFDDGRHKKYLPQNPFDQVKGYKYTLMNKVFPNFKHVLFGEAVAFPTTKIPIENTIYDTKIIYSEYTKEEKYNNIEQFLLHVYQYTKDRLESIHPIRFGTLSQKEIETIKHTFSPVLADTNVFHNGDSLEWLKERNMDLLYSLAENPRLMIEGAPGTGKTSMAMGYAEMRAERKGIYLCWNSLLCGYNELRFRANNVTIDCYTVIDFVSAFHPEAENKMFYYLDPDEMACVVKEAINYLQDKGQVPNYDYMIIDEAQDLFDRGLPLLMHKLCGNENGLKQGNIMLLYDLDQGFSLFGRDVSNYAYFLKEYFTHFKLHKIRRSAQKSQIRQIAEHIQSNPEEWEDVTSHQKEYDQIDLRLFHNSDELKRGMDEIVASIQDPLSSLEAEDVIVLVQSKVWQRRNNVADIIMDIGMEELTIDNLALKPSKLQYTTAVKFKGLERKNVILIVDVPNKLTPYEWYVGCTRAIENLSIWQLQTYKEHDAI